MNLYFKSSLTNDTLLPVSLLIIENYFLVAELLCYDKTLVLLLVFHNFYFMFQTGTLTEDGLDMWGVLPLEQGVFKPVVHTPTDMNPHSHMTSAMATCHSLTIINHEITGDPLDLKMFNSINFVRIKFSMMIISSNNCISILA